MKIFFFPCQNFIISSFLETLPRGHTRYNRLIVSTNHRPQYREQIQAKPLFPDFHITEIFVPFQGSRLDPRQGTRSYASTPRVSRTLFNSCSFVPHGRSRTPDRKRNNTVSRPVKRREARAIRDSSRFEQIFLTIERSSIERSTIDERFV